MAAPALWICTGCTTAYRDYLAEGRMDGAQEWPLPRADRTRNLAREDEIWGDGFAGFTALERTHADATGETARSMTITLLMVRTRGVLIDRNIHQTLHVIFRTERTAVMLRACLQANSVEWLKPIRLKPETPRVSPPAICPLEKTCSETRERRTRPTAHIRHTTHRGRYTGGRVAAAVRKSSAWCGHRTDTPHTGLAVIVRDLSLITTCSHPPWRPLHPLFIDRRRTRPSIAGRGAAGAPN
jgi:hypothetical protein